MGFKKTKIGLVPKDWEVIRLGDIYKNLKTGSTPSRKNPEYFKGDILWITSGELNYNKITDTFEKITQKAVLETNLTIYPKGTFLIAITGLEAKGTRGSCAITGVEATTNQSCMAFYENEKMKTDFLFQWYLYYGEYLAFRYAQGTKQQSFNNKIVSIMSLALPPLKEQEKIAQILSTWDRAIEKQEELIKAKERLKKGLMQKLLTGKVRFKGFNEEWKEVRLGEIARFYKGKGISKLNISNKGIECIRYGELYTHYKEKIFRIKSKTNLQKDKLIFSKKMIY